MTIRTIKKSTFLKDYKERQAFKEKTGTYPSACRVDYNFRDGEEPTLRIMNTHLGIGDSAHLSLFFISDDVVSHEGMVVGFHSETVRVMSDVWDTFTYAIVYEPNGPVGPGAESVEDPELFRHILIPHHEATASEQEFRFAIADASDETKEIYEYWKAGKVHAAAHEQAARYEKKKIEYAEIERRTVRKDKWVEVARGRKVAKGTKGLVFWLQDSQWGMKVGIALPEADGTFVTEARESRNGRTYDSYKNVAWTYAKNCEVIEAPETIDNIAKKAA